ncbi:sigma-70 family RNA polymerase sigma factor [Leucobacter insecticola]|uniref:Sigma-70 family RNA polymerase sigma factor n=1 Tax=Leucobacter insecticola TaxID=2714934 RepID=A0A6G8FJD0_9MICO|nr:sigma-70 family RNA polymerase sigma factor [Leucobacter insecticola]QIM16403.1 sigma-70 family RNA polymerase sigma factor [Leucobacter insecticola]
MSTFTTDDVSVDGALPSAHRNATHINTTLANLLPQLTGYFLRRLGNLDDAADAAADVLVVLLGKRNQLPREAEALRQYSFGVARKVLLKARRGRVRHTELSERLRREMVVAAPADQDPHPELMSALSRLSEPDRELLLLVAWEGLSVAEAGSILHLKPAAARQRYSRTRARLRTELG